MHAGPKTSPPTEEEEHLYKQMEEETLSTFLALCSQRANNDLSESSLQSTSEILKRIPENYSTYNYRREILLGLMHASEKLTVPILLKELELNTEILKEDFKCYAAFSHRHWIYEQFMQFAKDAKEESSLTSFQMLQKLVKKEQQQCEQLLQLDERNFHVWNYRRWVLELDSRVQKEAIPHISAGGDGENTASPPTCSLSSLSDGCFFSAEEMRDFSFTTRKIKQNFSNYSAWHHRSLVFQRAAARLFHNQESIDINNSAVITTLNSLYRFLAADIDLLCQAVYCDPNDQSAWFYAPFILDLYHQLSQIFFEAYKRGVLNGQHLELDGYTYDNIESLLKEFEGDLVDVFVFSVMNLMEEDLMGLERCFLPQSFLLLLFANLRCGRMCSVLEASNHLSSSSVLWSSAQMKKTSTSRLHQYAEWVLSRIHQKERVTEEGAAPHYERHANDAIDWLADYLTRVDASRSGMYRYLASLARGVENAAPSVDSTKV